MRKLFHLWFLLLSLVLIFLACIQTSAQTTVTGTIVDPNGNSYANGTAAAYTVATSGQPTTSTSPVITNSAGFFTLSLNANTYVFTICAPPVGLGPTQNPTPVQVCFTSSPIAISGPSQDVSTQLNSVAKVIGPRNAIGPVSRASIQPGVTADVQLSNAITALPGGSGVVWADYSTNQTWAACPTWGTGNVNVLLYPVTFAISVNCTIPNNIHLYHALGSCLSPATGTVTTYLAEPEASTYQIFCNALPGQGTIDFTGNLYRFDVYPEWWGANAPGATGTSNLNALQASIYGAFGCGPDACRTNGSGLTQYNKRWHLTSLYGINGTLQFYHTIGFHIDCDSKLASGIVQNSVNSRILDGQSNAYGTIDRCNWSTNVSQNVPLVDIDYDGTHGVDLRPQQITLTDNVFNGNGVGYIGIQIAKSGGGAQGDNIRCYNCDLLSFTEAGWAVGQPVGLSSCSTLATNAIREQIIGGDVQGNPNYGILFCGGEGDVIGTTFEDGFLTQSGFDFFCASTIGTDWCRGQGLRSESRRLMGGGKVILRDSWVIDQSAFPNPGSTCTPGIGGGIWQGSVPGGQGVWYKCSVGGTFSGLGTPGTPRTSSGGTATTEIDAAGGLTVNAWTGWQISWITGTCANDVAIITSNSATTYTFSAGIVTKFAGLTACAAPDATSTFVVEPPYITNFSTFADGTATLAGIGENAMNNIGGGGTTAVLDNDFFPGEPLNLNAASEVDYIRVTRSDWSSGAMPLSGTTAVKLVTGDYPASNFNNLFRKPVQPTFSNLPTAWPDGGPPLYCVDCTSTCGAGSSTGQMCNRVNGAWTNLNFLSRIASGTATLGTSAINSGTCATVVTVSAPGVLTTDTLSWSPSSDISGVTGYNPGGGLLIYQYPTANNVNFKVCNSAAGSVTPGSAIVLNWTVPR